MVSAYEDRRFLIRQPEVTVNGIDRLDVLDRAAFAGTPPQQTLVVRLFRALTPELRASITPANVRISGGVRVTSVGAAWVEPCDDVDAPGVSPDERDFYKTLAPAGEALIIRTDVAGDFSPYVLSIVDATGRPLAGFDPILSKVEFGFKVECPSQFDCMAEEQAAPAAAVGPRIDYLAKDFGSFKRVMLDRLSATLPEWSERNAADVGMVLVELLAYAGDHMSYWQDSVATEAYLGTARQRISLRRHARLLDYAMHEGSNARVWVCLTSAAEEEALDRSDLVFITRCDARPVVDPGDLTDLVVAQRPLVFEALHDVTLRSAHNEIAFYTWGEDTWSLAAGATSATLRDSTVASEALRLQAGDVLVLERNDVQDPAQRCAVRLTRVGDQEVDPLTGTAYVDVEWHSGDALPFELLVAQVGDDRCGVARGNVVLADHGWTRGPEELDRVAEDARRYRPILELREVTHAVPYDHAAAASLSATETLIQDAHDGEPCVKLDDGSEPWEAKATLLDSDAFDRHFVVEMDDRGRGHLRFGDGILGRQPDPNPEPLPALSATYRVGRGLAGNIGSDTIAHVVTARADAVSSARNPLPALGGVDPETKDEVRQYAPQAFRTQERAVTAEDYATVTETHAEVQKATATRRWTGSWYTMFIAVDRRGGVAVDDAFKAELRAYLEPYRLAGHDVEIEPPAFVPLDLALVVCVAPGHFQEQVHEALLEALSARQLSDGTLGFFHPDRFTFGQPVFLSQVVAAAMSVPGVDWIDTSDARCRFQRYGKAPAGELRNGVIPMARLEIAQLDNSIDRPENGRLDILFMGAA